MAASTMVAIDELINTFESNKEQKKITITKRVVKVETFSDNYHDFDMNELMNNKDLMQQILMMEQEEQKTNDTNTNIPIETSYLPSAKQLETIKHNLSDTKDISINTQSSIINYEHKFQIDRFQFAIQFMIFPKSFIQCWLGFIGTINNNSNRMRMSGCGGIGGQQMGGPMVMDNNNTNIVKHHYLSNLMISIPHRKPLNDGFGKTTMSSMPLISNVINNDNQNNSMDNMQQQMSDNNFMLSSNDLAMKLSKMLTRISKSTVQISCDIPSQILNAPISNRNPRSNIHDDINDTNLLFQIEKTVMNIYNNIPTKKN